MNCIYLRYTSI